MGAPSASLTVLDSSWISIRILDGNTPASYSYKDTDGDGTYGDDLPADNLVSADNTYYILISQTYTGMVVDVSYDSKSDKFTFTGDKQVAHIVGVLPQASFSLSPDTGTAPLTVYFVDYSTNSPTSWLWDFGDGGTSSSQNPSHTYNSAGTYTVSLTAANLCGSDTKIRSDYINVTAINPPVVSDPSASPS
ncbi:MAG: PKD domain-containing protein, partial [Deltaproteobacteria bacterium]|nr:PKD domain-containing protein [Deltaproteobacteria bacterium]